MEMVSECTVAGAGRGLLCWLMRIGLLGHQPRIRKIHWVVTQGEERHRGSTCYSSLRNIASQELCLHSSSSTSRTP